ncbi:MAG TPA: LssY C-terminal domain-containing protein [Acidobacteriaceae bacterium]|nr:LssY C-terminal domain-containing protein [Acidobacteriaceae bacterium]
MKILPNLIRGLGCVCFVCAAASAFGCDQVPAGETLWVRLTAPISTYSAKPGDAVHAVLTEDLVCDNEVVLPMGAPVEGVVRSRHKVGFGFIHETASLEIEFTRATARPGIPLDLVARVEEVENAREKVRNGVILGIRSTATVQGTANSRLKHLPTWNPYSDLILITYAATFPIFPEPEIYYPAGTDMRLETMKEIALPPGMAAAGHPSPSANPPEPDQPDPDQPEEDSLRQLVAEIPARVTNTRHVEADLINMVLLGSESQVKSAFHLVGWNGADSHGAGAWAKNFYALLNNSGYARQPMMKFLLDGKPEDMKWQRNLNSYGHRDHLRLWQWTGKAATGPVWAGSCTHDNSAAFNFRHFRFMHHVAPHIDDERSTVLRTLAFAGCVKSVSYVPRPDPITSLRSTMGELMLTDGDVAVVTLEDCRPVLPEADLSAKRARFKPGNYAFRYIRRQVLGYRNLIFRENFIYGAYALGRVTVKALRPKPPIAPIAKATPPHTKTQTRTAVAATR